MGDEEDEGDEVSGQNELERAIATITQRCVDRATRSALLALCGQDARLSIARLFEGEEDDVFIENLCGTLPRRPRRPPHGLGLLEAMDRYAEEHARSGRLWTQQVALALAIDPAGAPLVRLARGDELAAFAAGVIELLPCAASPDDAIFAHLGRRLRHAALLSGA